mmetsp:Transcript_82617/g.230385  ORF Transcript_82617/g.230385 Transcript_82617/m.230385 type:complete len:249 (-) Transcript_82617:1312-2058(-)
MVPRIAIGDRSTLPDASDVVPVIPPSHDTGVCRRIIPEPSVSSEVVFHSHFPTVVQFCLEDDHRVVQTLGVSVAIADELVDRRLECRARHGNDNQSCRKPHGPVDPWVVSRETVLHRQRISQLAGVQHRRQHPPASAQGRSHSPCPIQRNLLPRGAGLAHHSDDLLHTPLADDTDRKAREDGDNWRANENETDHLQRIMVRHRRVQEREVFARRLLVPAEKHANNGEVSRVAKVMLVRLLACGLVLGD